MSLLPGTVAAKLCILRVSRTYQARGTVCDSGQSRKGLSELPRASLANWHHQRYCKYRAERLASTKHIIRGPFQSPSRPAARLTFLCIWWKFERVSAQTSTIYVVPCRAGRAAARCPFGGRDFEKAVRTS